MKVKNLYIRCTEDFLSELKKIAEYNGLSVSAYITMLAQREINKNKTNTLD